MAPSKKKAATGPANAGVEKPPDVPGALAPEGNVAPALVEDGGDVPVGVDAEFKSGCGQAEIAADHARCVRETANAENRYQQLKGRSDDLRRAVYLHNLAVSSFEQTLANFNASFQAFVSALATYQAAIAGITYATTQIADWADQLQAQRGTLEAARTQVQDRFDTLSAEATDEKSQRSTLLDDIGRLIDELNLLMRPPNFPCYDCSRLRFVIAKLTALRANSNFQVKDPSGPPAQLPWVPILPFPPQPPTLLIRPPRTSPTTRVIVTGTPAFPNVPPVIYAGEVFPNAVPIEGAPRVCVGQVWWAWYAGFVGHVFRSSNEGVRGPRHLFTFQRDPAPTVQVGGGLDATDVYVSADGTRVYFTLAKKDQTAQEGKFDIVITDATGTVVKLRDPRDSSSPSLEFTSDLTRGLAGLHGSFAYLTVDSYFDAVRDKGDAARDAFYHLFTDASALYDEIVSRILARTDPDPASDDAGTWMKELHPDPPVLPLFTDIGRPGFRTPGFTSIWPGDVPDGYDVLLNSTFFATGNGRPTSDTMSDVNQLLNRIDQWAYELNLVQP